MCVGPWAAHFLGADLDALLLLKLMLICMTQILPCEASASHFAQSVIVHLQSCWMTYTHHCTFQGCDARHTDSCNHALLDLARPALDRAHANEGNGWSSLWCYQDTDFMSVNIASQAGASDDSDPACMRCPMQRWPLESAMRTCAHEKPFQICLGTAQAILLQPAGQMLAAYQLAGTRAVHEIQKAARQYDTVSKCLPSLP